MSNMTEILEAIRDLIITTKTIVACPGMPLEIPGIAAADAFDAGDTIGTLIELPVPIAGIIYSALFYDLMMWGLR